VGPNVPLHFTRFHPDYKLRNLPPTPLNTLNEARDTAVSQGCRFVYGGNAAGLKDSAGLKAENTYCPKCRTAVVERYGLNRPKIMLEKGKCPKCQEVIPGVWTPPAPEATSSKEPR
jgi:pyruvate formate lyase activating enzyme